MSTLTRLQWLGLAAVVGLLVLTTLGGTVRVTDSGLACPEWPLCYGAVFPTGDYPPFAGYQVWLEWTHRLVASVIGLVIVVYTGLCWWRMRERPWVWGPALASIVMLAVQVALGALTVTERLEPVIVTAHLAVAMSIVMLVTCSFVATFAHARAPAGSEAELGANRDAAAFGRLALLTGVAVYALIVVGSYVTHTDASFFCDNQWPLCNGDVWPGTAKAQLHVGHRLLAVAAGALVIAVSVQAARQSPRSRALVALAHGASTLFVVQVIFGALTMWLDLTDWIRVVHLSAGATVWTLVAALVGIAIWRAGWLSGARTTPTPAFEGER